MNGHVYPFKDNKPLPFYPWENDYLCGNCDSAIPAGCSVLGHYTPTGNLTGVKALDADGTVVHECGTKVAKGEGSHG